MFGSSATSLAAYTLAAAIYFFRLRGAPIDISSVSLWAFVVALMVGTIAGGLRTIALSTCVTMLFGEKERDKANGLIGTVTGVSFACTSFFSGLVIGFLGMYPALWIILISTVITAVHILSINIPEKEIVSSGLSHREKIDFGGTMRQVRLIPGLFGLIFFTTFNNFLGGVFMALMDSYGLSLVSVQTWGILWTVLSTGFIASGLLVSKFGLGKNPVKTLFTLNIIIWTSCLFFTIQPSIILLFIGTYTWMLCGPAIEASEHTIVQKVIPFERQGRVFGFAQSIESAATPFTAFLIGPITHFLFVPFMTTGKGAELIGSWFGTGPARGIALVFTVAGMVGLIVTLLSRRSKSAKLLAAKYAETSEQVAESSQTV
jgi:DHA3 family multidrug efflux protein-like MFS transporter